jgi:superfamily II DNA or RNA helicase
MLKNTLQSGLWFDPQSLATRTDPGAWARGLMLYRSQQVLSLDIEVMNGHWQLLGEVQGSRRAPYEVSVELSISASGRITSWGCDCECPVSIDCKHGVALTLKAAYQGLRLLGNNPAMPRASYRPSPEQVEAERLAALAQKQEQARMEAENQLLRWLQAIDRAGQPAVAMDDDEFDLPSLVRRKSPPKDEVFLYFIHLEGANTAKPTLRMEVVQSYIKQNGDWAKPKGLRGLPYAGLPIYDRATALDREVLQLVNALPDPHRYRYGYSVSNETSGQPMGRVGLLALEQAASTGRLFMAAADGTPGPVLRWGPPQPLQWQWHEVTTTQGGEPSWALRADLAEPGTKLCLNSPPLYLDLVHGLVGPVQSDGLNAEKLEVLLQAPALKPAALEKHQLPLLQSLGQLPPPPVLQSLTTLTDLVPTACLHIAPVPAQDAALKGLLQAQLRFDYGGHRGWWTGQGSSVLVQRGSEKFLLKRDLDAELDATLRLSELGLRSADKGFFGIPPGQSQQRWLQWADEGFATLREAGFEVSTEEALNSWVLRADALNVALEPQGGEGDALDEDGQEVTTSPWFDLSLGMEINGQRHNILPWLPELIAQASASALDTVTGLPELPPFIYLKAPGGQGFVRLPTDGLKPWMAALLELVGDRSHDFSGDSLKLSRLDAMRTTAALGEGVIWEGAQELRTMVQQLSGRAEMPEVPVPASLQASLRPYQQQGLNWLQFLRTHGLAGILADDMGLGKTLQTLAHIQVEKEGGRLTHPALIIAPVSLMGNWKREAERFCPQLRTLVLHGKDRHEVADTIAQQDIIIAPYSLLKRDRERWLDAKWHLVVLDEAQNIKNANTHAAQVVGELQARHRLCLSGTPMENHLGEIWSLFHFLMPGFLGSQKRFTELFRNPIEKQGNPERMTQLRARITPFMLRRTKALVAGELPPKVETVMRVELAGKQADLYETIRLGMEKTVREALSSKGLAKSQITILDALLKLRQVCCDPHLLKLPAAQKVKTSAKLEQLMELLPEMLSEGRRILLFSQFTTMLALIEDELKKRNISWVKLTGQSQNREALIEQFTSGQVPLFLISLKAGGVGLNLPQADTVIHYDPWWNPAAENQATDRAHRIGQTQSVFVYKLVAQGTIEERILALQERKAALADTMYSGSTGRKQPLFTEGDLAELLKPLSA